MPAKKLPKPPVFKRRAPIPAPRRYFPSAASVAGWVTKEGIPLSGLALTNRYIEEFSKLNGPYVK